jgi:hypothetical protein
MSSAAFFAVWQSSLSFVPAATAGGGAEVVGTADAGAVEVAVVDPAVGVESAPEHAVRVSREAQIRAVVVIRIRFTGADASRAGTSPSTPL